MKNILAFTILTITLLNNILSAQETSKMHIVGSAEFLPNELISNNNRDTNGEVCAGIMIVSDLEGLTYQSNNGIVDKQSQPGKDLVYVSPSERVIEIFKSGYEPIRIILSELSINLLSGKVWQIKITGDKPIELVPISIITNPKNCTVSINDSLVLNTKGLKLAHGRYKIKVEKLNYYGVSDSILVTNDNVYFEYNLTPYNTDLFFELPNEYEILLNNKSIGHIFEGKKSIPIGKHLLQLKTENIFLEKDIYLSEVKKKTVTISESNKSNYILMSCLVPGLGQAVSGRTLLGGIYFGGFVGTALNYFNMSSEYNDLNDQLIAKRTQLSNTTDVNLQYTLSQEITSLQRKVNSAEDDKSFSILLPIAVYAINIIDAFIFTPILREILVTDNLNFNSKILIGRQNDIIGKITIAF
jgi:Family of unknown function (DUF5683)